MSIALTEERALTRRQALSCLLDMSARYPYPRLFPLKKAVLKGLQGVVDDKKRAVRILAAKVRNEWTVMQQ